MGKQGANAITPRLVVRIHGLLRGAEIRMDKVKRKQLQQPSYELDPLLHLGEPEKCVWTLIGPKSDLYRRPCDNNMAKIGKHWDDDIVEWVNDSRCGHCGHEIEVKE